MDRRQFIGDSLSAGMALLGWRHIERLTEELTGLLPPQPMSLEPEESFWREVKAAYTVSPHILNLNNGGVSPQPRIVQRAVERYHQFSNELPSHYMWHILGKGRETVRQQLADLAGCDAEEIAIQRNATEALETIIFGLKLRAGDEIVAARQDYPSMINAWKQRAHRDGIRIRWVNLQLPSTDEDYLTRAYVDQFTERTRAVHLTHMINWCGQILPVRRIAREAHRRGIAVIVDGAQTFAHIDFDIPSLECDYFGTSLHKWLCAPFGTGMLYVRKSKISSLYPLFGAPDGPESTDIRKFEHLGTRSFALELAIAQAIQLQNRIGTRRKHRRLYALTDYWVQAVQGHPRIQIHTAVDPKWCGALALVQVDGLTPNELSARLFNRYRIHTVAIQWEDIRGVRFSPHVYTLKEDLDRLVDALLEIAEQSQ